MQMRKIQPVSVPFSCVEILVFSKCFLNFQQGMYWLIVVYCMCLCGLGRVWITQTALSNLYNLVLDADTSGCTSLIHWVVFPLAKFSSL